MKKKIYQFNQNNSGGHFDVDNKLCHRLLIEADSVDEASDIAEGMGVYYNGCDLGMDCECCGDRWYRPWSSDGIEFPYSYGTFTPDEANKIAEKYNCKVEKSTKVWADRDTNVIFETPEIFAQYTADNYGWTSPDIRIFYKNGEVKEIFSPNVR